jgi:ATP-dependent DNA helicase RecG
VLFSKLHVCNGNLEKCRSDRHSCDFSDNNAVLDNFQFRGDTFDDDIHVRIYDNRIEVLSPGKLPGYITPKNYLDERYARNPNLVRMLHRLPNPVNHDIGEGLNTARNAMRKQGLVPPVLVELDNAVVLTIEHRRITSLVEIIREYLETHETVSNKLIREISGEESENKVKKAFEKLRAAGEIEPVDPNAIRFKYEYREGKEGIYPRQLARELSLLS